MLSELAQVAFVPPNGDDAQAVLQRIVQRFADTGAPVPLEDLYLAFSDFNAKSVAWQLESDTGYVRIYQQATDPSAVPTVWGALSTPELFVDAFILLDGALQRACEARMASKTRVPLIGSGGLLEARDSSKRVGDMAVLLVASLQPYLAVTGNDLNASVQIHDEIRQCDRLVKFLAWKAQAAQSARKPSEVHASAQGWLVVATEWSSHNGGVSTLNRLLCRALAMAGERVVCLVPAADEDARQAAEADGVTLVVAPRAPGEDTLSGLWRRPTLPPGFEPSVIVGHGRITGPAAKALTDDQFPAARRLHLLHMAPDEIEWLKRRPGEDAAGRAERRTSQELELARGATAVAIGPRLHARYATDLHGHGQPQPLRLDPGFDGFPDRPVIPPPGSPMRVLMLGRLEDAELKGLGIAAKAVAKVRQRHDIELWVRGAPDGTGDELRERILADAGDPGLQVVVRHYTANRDVLATDLRMATLVLMPSRMEGFGLVGQEAITAAVPVLISSKSGLAQLLEEVLSPKDAQLHVIPVSGNDEKDLDDWVHGIRRTLDDPGAAFVRASEMRKTLVASITWARAAHVLIGWASQPPATSAGSPA